MIVAVGLVSAAVAGACVDAPITPDQLEADGQLRPAALGQVAFAAHASPTAQTAARVSAVLAAQPSGPLQDAAVFSADVGFVHLHLRADGLQADRPVTVRWTHDGVPVALPAELAEGGSMSLASSMPIAPDRTGHWRVEVLGVPPAGEDPPILFEREFEVVLPSEPATDDETDAVAADSEPSESEGPT